jgi:hypothetical protein
MSMQEEAVGVGQSPLGHASARMPIDQKCAGERSTMLA